jgi:predicted aspartyl protease
LIEGTVDEDGVPLILLAIGDQTQSMIIDTGFNGDLELPEILRSAVNPRFMGRVLSLLAGGQSVKEDLFAVTIPFDGRVIEAQATFSPELLGLIGTHLLEDYRLEIDFVGKTLILSRNDQSLE